MSERKRPSEQDVAHPVSRENSSNSEDDDFESGVMNYVDDIGKDSSRVITVTAIRSHGSDRPKELRITGVQRIGKGAFGTVYRAQLADSHETIAIKTAVQDKKFKNRELQIMRRLDHCNIVRLKYYFLSCSDNKDDVYLNLVMEFVPETLYRVTRHYHRQKQILPLKYIKVYTYQIFRCISYMSSVGICHRDIKPQNLLIDPDTGVLKLCDFGSAKHLVSGESNVAYICSRYYRAPELILGASDYTCMIDVWSAGCVFAELFIGQPLFPGESSVDQLAEIIKILGTPTRQQFLAMNKDVEDMNLPVVKPLPWRRVFTADTPAEAIDLVQKLLEYTPSTRLDPLQACAHAFFQELRDPRTRLPNGKELPPLFNFSREELRHHSSLESFLIPPHARKR